MSGPAPTLISSPSTPTTSRTRPIPRIINTTPSNSHHARRPSSSSYPSPIDIKPKSPAARRMSMTATSQTASIDISSISESAVDRALANPQVVLAGLVASVMFSGIIYSLIYSSSLNTSDIYHTHLPQRIAYFARKSNPFNVIFVKKAWGWTSLFYLLHLLTSPRSRSQLASTGSGLSSRIRRLGVWTLATMAWLLFTRWFFGAGVGDRIIALTGGNCAMPLPNGIDPHQARATFPSLFTSGESISTSEKGAGARLYLPLPEQYCMPGNRRPIDATSFPDLFALLSPSSALDQLSGATSDHASLQALPRPRWHKGFDISGHSFLLTLSVLILARELSPTWRMWKRRIESIWSPTPSLQSRIGKGGKISLVSQRQKGDRGSVAQIHHVVGVLATILVGGWIWMILMTAVYFHNPPEKLSGLLLGLSTSWLINALIPEISNDTASSDASASTVQLSGLDDDDDDEEIATRPSSFVPTRLFDENAARRGDVVDDGRILEHDDEDEDEVKETASSQRNGGLKYRGLGKPVEESDLGNASRSKAEKEESKAKVQ